MHDYSDLKRSVLYESIYENHYDSCTRKDCFCEQFIRNKGFSWEELQGHKYRNNFISQYFTQMFSEYLKQVYKNKSQKKKEYNQICFNYLTFLIEVVNVPTSALVEVVQIENAEKKNSSIKDQMIYQSIYDHGERTFFNFFNNPTIYNQKLQLHKVIEFDGLFLYSQKTLKNCLLFERDMLITLCQEYVDIQKLNEQVKKINNLKIETFSSIKKMYQYNPYSRRCQQITYIYSESLDLQKRKPYQYQKQAIFMNRKLHNGYVNLEREVPIFSQDACVIYISLLQPIGIIKNASQSTKKIFGYNPTELMNKNCNMLIPDQLKQIHDNILLKFVTSGQLNGINAGELAIFGIKQNGFAVPLTMRIRLDQTYANDFGASAFFGYQNNLSSEFVIFSTNGKVCNMTKKIYTQLFEMLIPLEGLKQTQKLDLFKMMPVLDVHLAQLLNKSQTLSLEHNSIFICPSSDKAVKIMSFQKDTRFNSMNDFLSIAKKINLHDFKFYTLSFRIGKLQTSYKGFSLGFIQVEKLSALKHKNDIKDHLKTVINELEKLRQYLEIEQDFENENSNEFTASIRGKQDNLGSILKNNKENIQGLSFLKQSNQQITVNGEKLKQKQHHHQKKKSMASYKSHNGQKINNEFLNESQNNLSQQIMQTDYDNHNVTIINYNTKITESNQQDQSQNIQPNTNRKLLNNINERHLQIDIKSDQSFDNHVSNLITPITSTKNNQTHFFDTKGAMSNEAIFIPNEQDEIQINHSDFLDSLFSSKSECGESILNSQPNNNQNTIDHKNHILTIQSNIQTIEQPNFNQAKKQQVKQEQLTLSNTPDGENSNMFKSKKNTLRDMSRTGVGTKKETQMDQNQASSVNSGQSEYHTLKNILLIAVSKGHKSKVMRFLYFTGLLSITILIIFITFLFAYLNHQFSLSHTFNRNLIKGYEIRNEFNNIITHTEYLKMYDKGIFENTLTTEELESITEELLLIQGRFKQRVNNFMNEDKDTMYGQYLRNEYQKITLFNERNISSTLTQRKIYTFITMTQNLYMYSQKKKETFLRYMQEQLKINKKYLLFFYYQQKNSHYNQLNILNTFQEVSDLQKEEMDLQITSMRSFLIIAFVLLEILTLIMAFQTIPIFYYIQFKREEILKLFCTFQPSHLKEKVRQCEYFANQDILQTINNQTVVNREITTMKKRTTSSTNNLQKINVPLIMLASIVFGFFSLYPIINYTLTSNFINQFEQFSNELNLIYSLRGRAPQIFMHNFLRQTATYENRPQTILSGIDSQLNTTQVYLTNTITELVNLLKSDSSSFYDESLHSKVVTVSMNEKLCDPLVAYSSQYMDSADQIDLSECQTLQNGLWNNGYLLGLQSIVEILKDYKEVYQITQTNDQFITSLKNLNKKDNGTNFIKVYEYIGYVPKFIGNFILSQTDEFYDQQIIYSLSIFIFVIILAAITFLILWNKYYDYLTDLIYHTKQIYGLFSYDFIHDNPFISNYVKKEYCS